MRSHGETGDPSATGVSKKAQHTGASRQAFLLRLSDTLRGELDAAAIGRAATRMIGGYLAVDRCYIARLSRSADRAWLEHEFRRPDLASVAGECRLSDFPESMRRIETEPLIYADIQQDPALSALDRKSFAAMGIGACAAAMLRKGAANFIWALVVAMQEPRKWSAEEFLLLEEVAERTWSAIERAQTEAELREREADLARVQRIGQVGGLNIDVAGGMRSWRSPEYMRLHGLPENTVEETHEQWRARVYPDDRESADRALFTALHSDAAVYESEYRIVRPSDGAIRWIHARADIERAADGTPTRLVGAHIDVTDQKELQDALRATEERQAFLLTLSDALRPLSKPEDIQRVASRMAGERLRVANANYALIENEQGESYYVVRHSYAAPGHRSVDGRYRLADFPGVTGALLTGRTMVVGDVAADSRLKAEDKAAYAAAGVATFVMAPLVKEGILAAVFAVHAPQPRFWTDAEIALLEDIAERTWAAVERAGVEAALRESENKYRTLFETMGQGYCELELLRDASGRAVNQRYLEFNPAFERLFGIPVALAKGRTSREIFPDLDTWWYEAFDRVVRRSEPERLEYQVASLGRWFEVFAYPRGGDCLTVLYEDITGRKQTELALRENEERFRQFAAASSGALWIRDAATLAMEYVSPAITTIYGVAADALLGDVKRWAALIIPEDRKTAMKHLERARQGKAVVHEFRIQRPTDHAFRWIRNIDFPLRDAQGRIQRIGGIAEDVTEAKLAVEHQGVLLAELQHRVRNIMAVIRSIAARTGENASTVDEYAELIAGRFLTLARVQTLLTRAANVGVGISAVVQEEIAAQARHAGQYTISGPDIILSPKAAEVLTLAVHELATNALKYGALSSDTGHIAVTWNTFERRGMSWLRFGWSERGSPQTWGPAPRRRGFGSELIEGRIPYELGGSGRIEIGLGGAHCHLEFPLKEGDASILETDAPNRGTVFGGTLDMSGATDLTGQRILVVEDDYYLATDTARAVRGAGAEVLGPFPTEDAALEEIREISPTGAVVDINLGEGPSFKIAESLKEAGIPFVFVTGYDDVVIPAEFAGVRRLQKPVNLRQIVNELGESLGTSN